MSNSIQIIRLHDASKKTGLSRSTIYELIKKGEFPEQVHLGPRVMGFIESEIDAWLEAKMAQRTARAA